MSGVMFFPTASMLPRHQRGVTLVELMVALVIGLFVALAAIAALTVARTGFTAVDAGSQLRENARFTADLVQRISVQAGFADASLTDDRPTPTGSAPSGDDPRVPGIRGFDNAWLVPNTDPASVTSDSRPTACGSVTDTSCNNFSDVLVITYQGASAPGSTTADRSMINCAGIGEPYVAPQPAPAVVPRAFSVFHLIRTPDGEPALACTYRDPVGGAWTTQTLVKGVESFQVQYGTDDVIALHAPQASSNGQLGAVDGYRTAKDMVAPAGLASEDTTNNWRRVRSLRISLLFRGDIGSRSPRPNAAETISLGMPANSNDTVGQALTVQSQTDGRLRQLMVFTVHLRNQQGYDLGCSATYIC